MLLTLFSIVFLLIISSWLILFFFLNDFSVPTISSQKFKKILVVYPHPDDEALTAGGLMAKNAHSSLLLFTKGERGTPDAHLDPRLKKIRSLEAQNSVKILRVQKFVHLDLGDGQLPRKKNILAKEITKAIKNDQPDLIITYDPSGLYGHPDHMVVSEITTQLVKKNFPEIELWYASLPQKIYRHLKLPIHMAKDKTFASKRAYPTHKIFIGLKVINKIRGIRAHKSQHSSFQKGLPIPVPKVFFDSMTIFEYFHKMS